MNFNFKLNPYNWKIEKYLYIYFKLDMNAPLRCAKVKEKELEQWILSKHRNFPSIYVFHMSHNQIPVEVYDNDELKGVRL